jgi:hypothetical protein
VASVFYKSTLSVKARALRLPIKHVFLLLTLSQLFAFTAHAQDADYDSLLNYYLKSDSVLLDELELELAMDSLDIYDLMDSLLEADFSFSQLSLRIGYTSNITYAGRNFGINQHGFGAGASFYHQTGLFADISGFWNSDVQPNYNPTITTLGYMGNLTNKWTYTISYDHFFYNMSATEDELIYYPLSNSLNLSTYLELGKFTLAGDYSYLFGEETAHRARGSLMYTFSKSHWGFIDRFVFMPSVSMLLGNSDIYQISTVYPEMNFDTRYAIRQILFEQYGRELIKYLINNKRDRYLELERLTYEDYKEELSDYVITSDNVFGIMNYSLTVPLYFYINNFTIALSYHYNIPVALPGEELSLTPNSYAGATLIYNIPFRKKK